MFIRNSFLSFFGLLFCLHNSSSANNTLIWMYIWNCLHPLQGFLLFEIIYIWKRKGKGCETFTSTYSAEWLSDTSYPSPLTLAWSSSKTCISKTFLTCSTCSACSPTSAKKIKISSMYGELPCVYPFIQCVLSPHVGTGGSINISYYTIQTEK